MLVSDGDVCGCAGACGNAAINRADGMKYAADVAAARKLCPGGAPQVCPLACIYSELACVAGTCAVCHAQGCSADAGAHDASHD
jgi:hypothetical protein